MNRYITELVYISEIYLIGLNSLMESRLCGHKNRLCASVCDFFAYDVVIEEERLRNNS